MPLSLKDKLARVLVEKNLVSEDKIRHAVEKQNKSGGKLSDILVEMKLISKDQLTLILCEEFQCPFMSLSRYKISPDLAKLIPKKMAKQYKMVPVSRMGTVLTVAMSDPLDVLAIDNIRVLTGCDIGLVIAPEKDIENAIMMTYDGMTHETLEQMVEGIGDESEIRLKEAGNEGGEQADTLKMSPDAPLIRVTNLLLSEAVKKRASDILIEPGEEALRVRYRIDGVLVEARKAAKKIHSSIVSRLKVMANLNIAEHRLPQDGRFKIKMHDREVDFRLSILPTNIGEKAALRVLDKSQAMLDLDTLGFDSDSLESIKLISARPHGMILACGPTGCGKTTTLYSILKHVDSPEKNIVTVEDPVEYQLKGINQVSVKPDIGLTFSGSLRSILRQDPDVIMIGEIRDFETVDIAIKAALTGHLVLSTLHTTTASGSIVRLINMGVEPFLISSSLLVIIAQRLVRRICPRCKKAVTPDKRTAEALGIQPGSTVYRGEGCANCQNTGYRGRLGIAEVLVMSSAIKDMVLGRVQEHELREAAKKEGMKSLREGALKKLLAGDTSVDEVLRVTVGDQDIGA
ncbi:MAG: ATPase, T2SS/T4P/T4SS family [Candidatus Omnitrophota bacterium]